MAEIEIVLSHYDVQGESGANSMTDKFFKNLAVVTNEAGSTAQRRFDKMENLVAEVEGAGLNFLNAGEPALEIGNEVWRHMPIVDLNLVLTVGGVTVSQPKGA